MLNHVLFRYQPDGFKNIQAKWRLFFDTYLRPPSQNIHQNHNLFFFMFASYLQLLIAYRRFECTHNSKHRNRYMSTIKYLCILYSLWCQVCRPSVVLKVFILYVASAAKIHERRRSEWIQAALILLRCQIQSY